MPREISRSAERDKGFAPLTCPLAGGRLLKKAGENFREGQLNFCEGARKLKSETAKPFRNLTANSPFLSKSF